MKHVLDSTKDIFSLATNGILQNPFPQPGMPDSIISICYFTHIHSFNGVACFYFTY